MLKFMSSIGNGKTQILTPNTNTVFLPTVEERTEGETEVCLKETEKA